MPININVRASRKMNERNMVYKYLAHLQRSFKILASNGFMFDCPNCGVREYISTNIFLNPDDISQTPLEVYDYSREPFPVTRCNCLTCGEQVEVSIKEVTSFIEYAPTVSSSKFEIAGVMPSHVFAVTMVVRDTHSGTVYIVFGGTRNKSHFIINKVGCFYFEDSMLGEVLPYTEIILSDQGVPHGIYEACAHAQARLLENLINLGVKL
jgi:hypothetical protein